MPTLKYYATIHRMQSSPPSPPAAADVRFDLDDLIPRGLSGWLSQATAGLRDRALLAAFWLMREFWPNPRIGRLVLVSRDADVREVLARSDTFGVPFGLEMTELAGGANFVLGLDGPQHDAQNATIRAVMLPGDAERIRLLSRRSSAALIRAADGRIDVMQGFLTRVAAETCCGYFGLVPEDFDAFADWTIAMSALLFADPFGSESTRRRALFAAARVRHVVDGAIAAQRGAPNPDTVLGRLLALRNSDPTLTEQTIRAIITGLVIGFIPTNSLAAGKILEALLDRPDAMREAVGRAERGDMKGLQEALIEAARLNPALAPGQWRYVNQTATIAQGTSRAREAPAASVLLVATMSALRDHRANPDPGAFRLGRPDGAADLVFGMSPHVCLGKFVALAQISELFAVLLAQKGLRPASGAAGRIAWAGPYPRHLTIEFQAGAPRAG